MCFLFTIRRLIWRDIIGIMIDSLLEYFRSTNSKINSRRYKCCTSAARWNIYLYIKYNDFLREKINNWRNFSVKCVATIKSGGEYCHYTLKCKLKYIIQNKMHASMNILASGDRATLINIWFFSRVKWLMNWYTLPRDECHTSLLRIVNIGSGQILAMLCRKQTKALLNRHWISIGASLNSDYRTKEIYYWCFQATHTMTNRIEHVIWRDWLMSSWYKDTHCVPSTCKLNRYWGKPVVIMACTYSRAGDKSLAVAHIHLMLLLLIWKNFLFIWVKMWDEL